MQEIELSKANILLGKYCEKRIYCQDEIKLRLFHIIKGNKAILIESHRDHEDPEQWTERPVAHFEYKETTEGWSVFGYNWDSKSLTYLNGPLEKLIQEVDKDPSGIFWGKQGNIPCRTKPRYITPCKQKETGNHGIQEPTA